MKKLPLLFSQLVLLLMLVITSIAPVNAKVASGLQELGGGLSQGQTSVESLLRLGSSESSYDEASGSSLVPKGAGKKQRNKALDPLPEAQGRPHSIVEKPGPQGQYTTHNADGTFKQFRGSGKPHGNIPRPNVKENSVNRAPDGREFIGKPTVRPARPDEMPGGG